MSIVPKESIEVIAQSIGISNLSSDAALALAPDVEYRVREIMQEAIKCMRHSKRTTLTTDDVDSSLSLRNVEPVYGFASGDPLRFKRAVGRKDLFYIDDKEVDLKDVIEAPLPKAPLEAAVVVHWLAIEGVQPAIPENVAVEVVAPSENKKLEHRREDVLPVDIKLPVKHVLSRELQLYFDKITELTLNRSDSIPFKEALSSLATDSGLHPLVPYFSYFIAEEVTRNLNDLSLLVALMRVVQSLLWNPQIHIEPYLHQLMPSIITCLVAKRLGHRLSDDHWELRDFSASLISSICRRFGHVYHNLQSRVTKTLLSALLDPTKSMTQHYGAIQGLSALGVNVVRLLILPNLEPYLKLLEPEMLPEKQKNEVKRNEAWRVYGALMRAAGNCVYERLKTVPGLFSWSARQVLKPNASVDLSTLNKRKSMGTDILAHQPPPKKLIVNAPAPTISMPTAAAAQAGGNGITSSSRSQRAVGGNGSKSTEVLTLAWKDDVDAGNLLSSLFELFGEGMLSFVQSPELFLHL